MPTNYPELSDDELRKQAQGGAEGYQAAAIEAMRRLRNSIDALRASTDIYSRWLLGLTVLLSMLTALQVYKVFWP